MDERVRYFEHKLEFAIDSWDLHAALQTPTPPVVLDVRTTEAFEREHIAGAISFPHKLITAENVGHLRRNALYVTYCDGEGCNASTAGALKLAKLGFTVKELQGGLSWWRAHNYPTLHGDHHVRQENASCECG